MMAPPLSPSKAKEIELVNLKINLTIEKLSWRWSLCLEPPKSHESPSKRSGGTRTIEQEIVFKIKALCFRDTIDPLVQKFDDEATTLYTGWVKNPKADRGIVPERTRHSKIAVTQKERKGLLSCLLRILTEQYDATMTPKKKLLPTGNPNSSIEAQSQRKLDDSPIPFSVSKRSREQLQEEGSTFKKPRLPPPGPSFSRTYSMQAGSTRSAQTSFASETASIFSNPQFNTSNKSLPEVFTQETAPTQSTQPLKSKAADLSVDMHYREPLNTSFEEKAQSSGYEGGSSFDAALLEVGDSNLFGVGQSDPIVDDELSQDMLEQAALGGPEVFELGEEALKKRLRGIFPDLPLFLCNAPLCVAYEVTRVFLHVGVSLNERGIPPLPKAAKDYNKLQQFLKGLPVLQGKSFPERCSLQAWDAAINDFHYGTRSVYMTGSLRFNQADESGPLFRLQLGALRLDASHRCGRRFGYDRFFEIDIPAITGRNIPSCLQQAGKRGPEVIIEWLVDERHHFLNRVWKPFHLKPKERNRKNDSSQQSSDDPEPIHRLFFFAIDGKDFIEGQMPEDSSKPYVQFAIDQLLNRIRPTRENVKQSYLKLFSRTSLALSRNSPTGVLDKSQIRYKDDILNGEDVMTDGAGRISRFFADALRAKLGLSYLPSGFQGRIGEAKGFWSVDYKDKSEEKWIEIYRNQRKWERSEESNGESDDPSHREFEVLKCSGPLKSADLNLQLLPLLVDRARCQKTMKNTIARLLVQGLDLEIEALRAAMNSPQTFRKWIYESNSNMKEKLRSGAVSFRAGLPISIEERINVLLDVGFEPVSLYFLKEMARALIKSKCEDLRKRLNITVGQSSYVYMIPDFRGVLEPGEVYIDLSGFVDRVSGRTGVDTNDVELLVARSPAHHVSDIQKVKAVLKVEFMMFKDVIVFPTKGPSLAKKLSGGDFDGDIAWCCWEKSIVENFVNADVPELPDLVKEGYIRKDTTTYEDLVFGHSTPISIFLKKSFAFSMEQSLLGICTNFKENLCYTSGSLSDNQAVYMSKLLGDLVDLPKQGFRFNDDDWARFRRDKIITTPRQPLYRTDHVDEKANHVIDHLMYIAKKTIDDKLTEFHNSFTEEAHHWDPELVGYYKWAKEQAKEAPAGEWATLLENLNADLTIIKNEWTAHFSGNPNAESKPSFVPFVISHHEKFQAIRPHDDTPFTQGLHPACFPDPEVTNWALLKASAFFALNKPNYVQTAVWWLAGKQLAQLKCSWRGGMMVFTPSMHVIMKPDASIVRGMRTEKDEALVWENKAPPSTVDELEEMMDDD